MGMKIGTTDLTQILDGNFLCLRHAQALALIAGEHPPVGLLARWVMLQDPGDRR